MMRVRDYLKPWIPTLEKYVPGEYREGYIKLASNESNYGPSPKVVEAIRENAARSHVYPHLDDVVRRKCAKYAGVDADCVVVGNGSDELMELVLKTFDGGVAGFKPSYASYRLFPMMLGMQYSEVNLGRDFSFPVDEFIKKTKKSSICFIGSPNNPTGNVVGEEDLLKVLKEDKIVVLDEAYFEFHGKSLVRLTREYENLIVLRTLSKAFGLGGLRVGYAIGDPETMGYVSKLKPPFSIASISEVAALAALDDLGYMRGCVSKISRDRGRLYKALDSKFRAYPSRANFVLADVSPMTSQEFFNRMLEQKIIVRTFGKISGFEGDYVRVAVGTEKQNKKLIEALDKIRVR